MKYSSNIFANTDEPSGVLSKFVQCELFENPPRTVEDFSEIVEKCKEKRLGLKKYFHIPQFQDNFRLMGQSSEDDHYTFRKTVNNKSHCILGDDSLDPPFDLATRGIFFTAYHYIKVNRSKAYKENLHIVGFTENGTWVDCDVNYESYQLEERFELSNGSDPMPPFFKHIQLKVRKIECVELFKILKHGNDSINDTAKRIIFRINEELSRQVAEHKERISYANNFLEKGMIIESALNLLQRQE